MNKFEKIFYTALMILAIFILGIQIGIYHGKQLQIEEIVEKYDY